jgi:hypothetical protein
MTEHVLTNGNNPYVIAWRAGGDKTRLEIMKELMRAILTPAASKDEERNAEHAAVLAGVLIDMPE